MLVRLASCRGTQRQMRRKDIGFRNARRTEQVAKARNDKWLLPKRRIHDVHRMRNHTQHHQPHKAAIAYYPDKLPWCVV